MPAAGPPASRRALEEARFRPLGLVLRLRTDHRAVLAAAEDAFRGFGPVDPGAAPDLDVLLLARRRGDDGACARGSAGSGGNAGPGAGGGDRQAGGDGGPPVYAEHGDRVVVADRGSTLIVDRRRGRARGRLAPELLADAARLRVEILELALQLMLPARGWLGVHGAAVVAGRSAALLRATGGGGKTTLAYAAASHRRLGLRVLAEDVVWIDLARGWWWGLPWWAHPRPEAGSLFPELGGRAPVLWRGGGPKLAVALESIRPGSTAPRARPGPVVLLHRRPGTAAAVGLIPLALPEALELWTAGRAGTEVDFPGYRHHVEKLLRGNAWRLDVGDGLDSVLAALAAVAELLAAAEHADRAPGTAADPATAPCPVIPCQPEPMRQAEAPGMTSQPSQQPARPEQPEQPRILQAGEFHHKERFGPETVNRGAVLLECEWDGGVFESGVMLGGLFRDGEFRGGTFWGGIFWAGRWRGGTWESGFDREGRYRPRTDAPEYA
jgi:hypothetical protein